MRVTVTGHGWDNLYDQFQLPTYIRWNTNNPTDMAVIIYATGMSTPYRCFSVTIHQWYSAPVENNTLEYFGHGWDVFHSSNVKAYISM